MDNTTPTVRCPRCDHPINEHSGRGHECRTAQCRCLLTPNLIAVAAVQTALYGGLTP